MCNRYGSGAMQCDLSVMQMSDGAAISTSASVVVNNIPISLDSMVYLGGVPPTSVCTSISHWSMLDVFINIT